MTETGSLKHDLDLYETVHARHGQNQSWMWLPTRNLSHSDTTIEGVLTFPLWAPLVSDGVGSAGICGIFRPMIPLTDLSDLDGDALVGDPCPAEYHEEVDTTVFLRAGFRLGLALAIATGVGIRLLSST